MLMAAVVPRDTVVTYKPPRGTKVNLSTANHVALADTGSVRLVKGDLGPEEERSLSLPTRGRHKAPLIQNGSAITNHLITAELNQCTGSLSSLCHTPSNGVVPHMARPAFTRSATIRSANGPLRSSSIGGALDRPSSPCKPQLPFSRTSSAGSDTNDSRHSSTHSIAADDINVAIPVEEEEEKVEVEERLLKNPRVVMLKSNSLTFTPVIVSQQPPQRDQHGCQPRVLNPTPVNLQQRRSGLRVDPPRRASYRANKTVSFDCETRTETFETDLTESENDEREFVHLMGHYERRPQVRLPMTHDDEYCPPGKEEQDFLPKVLCFALALVITGGILYGLNIIISRMNMNLFSG